MQTLKRDHVFDQQPYGFTPGQGIPLYMECLCGRRWYADKPKPRSSCKARRQSP